MASLKPGILQKLLQNVGNKDAKVVGEHRCALLQVIGIVPSLDDDPWKSRCFYLRVSDSMHSAYVTVPDEDVELILSDEIQLGQFIHVTRLDPRSPVPVLCGLKPVPKRRPCLGDPKDLISSDALTARKNVDSKRVKKHMGLEKKVEAKENLKGKVKRTMETKDLKSRRLSLSSGVLPGLEIRRLSLDSMRKGWDQRPEANRGVMAVTKLKTKQGSSGSDSAVDSEKGPSNDPSSKHLPISPLRTKNVIASPKLPSKTVRKELKSSTNETPNVIASPKLPSKTVRKELKSSTNETLPVHLKEDLNFANWSDSKIYCNSIPDTIHNLGKDVRTYRSTSFLSAVHAIEEASAAERVICCMSNFAELSESSQRDAAGPFVEKFLILHEDMSKVAVLIKSLVETRMLEAKSNLSCSLHNQLPDICCDFANNNAMSWVQAAVETDLSRFSLLIREEKKAILNGEKGLYLMIENAQKKVATGNSPSKNKSSINHDRVKSESNLKRSPLSSRGIHSVTKETKLEREEWVKGKGLNDAANLAEKLLSFSSEWFLNYLENILDQGCGLRNGETNSERAGLLGQLKRVNGWLDDSFPQGTGVEKRIEDLKKKLYGFLLDNVDSAVLSKR